MPLFSFEFQNLEATITVKALAVTVIVTDQRHVADNSRDSRWLYYYSVYVFGVGRDEARVVAPIVKKKKKKKKKTKKKKKKKK